MLAVRCKKDNPWENLADDSYLYSLNETQITVKKTSLSAINLDPGFLELFPENAGYFSEL